MRCLQHQHAAHAHRRTQRQVDCIGCGRTGAAFEQLVRRTARLVYARAYLDATAEATGAEDADFAARVAAADAYLHAFDVAERDLLDGDAGADAMGGFSAAAASLGAAPALYSLDTSRPEAPKARTAREDVARLVRGRLTHPRWIAAQLRHGWRGAQELAQGLDAVFVMAAATDAVADAEIDRLYDAYLGDPEVLAAIEEANPGVAEALRSRFAELRDRGLWQSRRNSLAALEPREAAE